MFKVLFTLILFFVAAAIIASVIIMGHHFLFKQEMDDILEDAVEDKTREIVDDAADKIKH